MRQSTYRVLSILQLLANNLSGMNLTDIAKALSSPKSSIKPIVDTMVEMDFLKRSPDNPMLFCIGQKTFIAGSSYTYNYEIRDVIYDRLRALSRSVEEICQFAILQDTQVFYLYRAEPIAPIKLRSQEIRTLPAYCTGLGKALLSDFSQKELEAIYGKSMKQYTTRTITTSKKLYEVLVSYRKEDFYYEHGELLPGIECIAAPIRVENKTVAAVSITMIEGERYKTKLELAKERLSECRNDLEKSFKAYNIAKSTDLL